MRDSPFSQHRSYTSARGREQDRTARVREITEQIRVLSEELAQLAVSSSADNSERQQSVDVPCVGDKVIVVGGKYRGKVGKICAPKGRHYWWIELDGNNDCPKIYVMKSNVSYLEH